LFLTMADSSSRNFLMSSLSEAQIEQLQQEAIDIHNRGIEPSLDSWGFFSYSDGPAAAGGGLGVFHWFQTFQEMSGYIGKHLPFLDDGPSSDDPQPVAEKVASIVESCKTPQDLVSRIPDLNTTLASYSQIEWAGTFNDLCNDEHEYAAKVRKDFWEQSGDSNDKAIGSGQIEQFKDYISTYGI